MKCGNYYNKFEFQNICSIGDSYIKKTMTFSIVIQDGTPEYIAETIRQSIGEQDFCI